MCVNKGVAAAFTVLVKRGSIPYHMRTFVGQQGNNSVENIQFLSVEMVVKHWEFRF